MPRNAPQSGDIHSPERGARADKEPRTRGDGRKVIQSARNLPRLRHSGEDHAELFVAFPATLDVLRDAPISLPKVENDVHPCPPAACRPHAAVWHGLCVTWKARRALSPDNGF